MKNNLKMRIDITLSITYAITLIFLINTANAQQWVKEISPATGKSYGEAKKEFHEYWQGKKPAKGTGYKQFRRMEYFWDSRLDASGKMPDLTSIFIESGKYIDNIKNNNSPMAANEWKFLGPTLRPKRSMSLLPPGLGRINCITFDPTDQNIIWAGSASGGVWKSTDAGASWQTFPFTSFLSIGISDIGVAKSNPQIVYAVTGDADAAGAFGSIFNYSIGIIKTSDGGANWILAGLGGALANNMVINKLIVHPTDAGIVYAAANTGVYFTSDGGGNWNKISNDYCKDLKFMVDNPNFLIGAFISGNAYQIRKCDVGQNKWTTNFTTNESTRIALALSPTNSNIMYAVLVDYQMGFHSLLRSINGGNSWTTVSSKTNTPNILGLEANGSSVGGQGMYDLCIAVSPANQYTVYIGGINIWKSVDGGSNWSLNAEWTGNGVPFIHADHHSLVFDKNGVLYSGNDGGIGKTNDGGKSWSDEISNGLAITQFYRISCSTQNPDYLIGGTQDNGTSKIDAGGWQNIFGGDGMENVIDYSNDKNIYISTYDGEFYRSDDGGNSFWPSINAKTTGESGYWVSPFAIDPQNPDLLYAAHQNVWKSTNKGVNWTKTTSLKANNAQVQALAIAPSDSKFIYASTRYDGSGFKLWLSTNAGSTWAQFYQTASLINGIAVDPKNPRRVWLALGGYHAESKVSYYDGSGWNNISGSLPNVPVNCILYQKNSPDRLYIGTDIGVFARDEANPEWALLGTGLPNVIVSDLEIQYSSGNLRAGTFGRGLWEIKVNDCNLAPPEIEAKGSVNICPGDSVQISCKGDFPLYRWSNGAKTKSIYAKESGDYQLEITDANGCSARSAVMNVNVVNIPRMVARVLNGKKLCSGESITLSASVTFERFVWSNGDTTREITINKPGDYIVTGTTADGCKASDTINIPQYDNPSKPTITKTGNLLSCDSAASYQWYSVSGAVDGATKRTYLAAADGKYYVVIKNEFGCSSQSDTIDFATGIDDFSGITEKFSVVPNPSTGEFSITGTIAIAGKVSLNIANSLGMGVYSSSEDFPGGNYTKKINLGSLPSGVYYATVHTIGHQHILKIIKN